MKVFVRAPMRIDWAGGWTDVPQYADEHGGVVVNSAIDLYAHVELYMGGGRRIRLHAEDTDEHVTLEAAPDMRYDGKLDLHKAALNMLPVTGGIEIISRSDAPIGAGLGGSGALDVALVAGLARCRHEQFDAAEIAEMGFLLETSELGLAGGRQDQYAAALGGSHRLDFAAQGVKARRLALRGGETELPQHLVLAYTGRSHFSSQTHDRVWGRYEVRDADVNDALATLRDLPAAAADALEAADWRRLAEVVDENWRQQQRLDVTIATPMTRGMDRAARNAGAWGLKATGAGAGGCLAVLTPPERRAAVAAALEELGAAILNVAFVADGVDVRVEPDEDDAP